MDNMKKKRIKRMVRWIAMALVVVMLAMMPLIARTEAEEDGPKATVHSGTVTTGSISMTLHGGGVLEAEDVEDVTLPDGVKITGFLVKNGDLVKEGDPLAEVDPVSVMTAVTKVNETLEYLREEMADAREETVDDTVRATAGGRVKQVFAQPGDRVEDVMLEHGALAVLSLDGLMAVEISRTVPLTTGDSVRVTLSDGKEVDGRVESGLDGLAVITVEDEGYAIGEPVTVTTPDGQLAGAGSLYIHNAWKATAFSGTVSKVSVKPESKVTSGATLLTLKDTDFRGRLAYLAGLHREYEELLQDLFKMAQDGVIAAPCDGEISGVEEDSVHLLSAVDGEQGWYVDLLSAETSGEKEWTVILLSGGGEEVPCTGLTGCEATTHNPGCPEICLVGESCLATLHHEPGCIKLCDQTALCPAIVHYPACLSHCDNNKDCTAIAHLETCPWHTVTYSAYAAKVFAAGANELVLYMDASTQYKVVAKENGWALENPDALNPSLMITETVWPVADGSRYSAGDIVLLVTGVGTDGTVLTQDVVIHQKAQSGGGVPGFPGFGDLSALFGGLYGGFGGAAAETEPELFDLEGSVLMTVTPRNAAKLVITLDEKDIGRVSMGQYAQVKVGALRGQVFDAEVSKVSRTGANSGGSSKYAVELTLEMAPDMIPGMSATATLPLYTETDVPTIPVAALVEDGPHTLVYTALDEKTGQPADPVRVSVGISDGETAQLLSGLEPGDKYYYSYYDVLELSTDVEPEGFSFGG